MVLPFIRWFHTGVTLDVAIILTYATVTTSYTVSFTVKLVWWDDAGCIRESFFCSDTNFTFMSWWHGHTLMQWVSCKPVTMNRLVFDPRFLSVESVVDDVAMGQIFLSVLSFFPVSFVLPVVHTHLSPQTLCNVSNWQLCYWTHWNDIWNSVPLQAWSGPEGSRKLRFPDFMTTAQGGDKVSLTHRPHLSPGNSPGTHFC